MLLYESMPDRHWKELRVEVKGTSTRIQTSSPLKKVFSQNLLQHQEKIEGICSHACKQLKIEKSLTYNNIRYMWERPQPPT